MDDLTSESLAEMALLKNTMPDLSDVAALTSSFDSSSIAAALAMKSSIPDLTAMNVFKDDLIGKAIAAHTSTMPDLSHVAALTSSFDSSSIAAALAMKSSIPDLTAINVFKDDLIGKAIAAHTFTMPDLSHVAALTSSFDSSSIAAALAIKSSIPDLTAMNVFKDDLIGKAIAAYAFTMPDLSDVTALKSSFDGSSIGAALAFQDSMPDVKSYLLNSPSYSAFTTIRNSLSEIVDGKHGFQFSQIAGIKKVFEEYHSDHAAYFKGGELKSYLLDQISGSMERMRIPSLDIVGAAASVKGVLEVHRMASVIDRFTAFNDKTGAVLRGLLGDWRDLQDLSSISFEQKENRGRFYVDQGLDNSLTNFTPTAFEELAEGSGLRIETTSLAKMFGEPVPIAQGEEVELGRAMEAYGYLVRFERFIRKAIDDAMTKEFGEDWPRRQLPNGVHDSWVEKKKKADREGGARLRLIDYADFTDYERIIAKRDNWSKVFFAFFNTQESIRESLRRLQPVRICAMHSREVTNDDMLYLYVEIKRITSAFMKKIEVTLRK
ncbi:hypothetical protein [Dyella jejuensis]